MASLPTEEKQLRYFTYLGWLRADKPVEELAATYDLGSPEALYRVLREDGFPVCEVCGEYSKSARHCEQTNALRERQARRGEGEAQELPPAGEAIPLFIEALKSLSEKIDALRNNRKEYLQDERFVAADEYRDPIIWPRGPMSDEQWKNLCERVGQDPGSDRFELWDARFVEPVGARQSPPEPLATLIGVYVLAGLPLPPLLECLHFAPENVDEGELTRHIEGEEIKKPGKDGKTRTQQIPGLKTKAAQVAQLIRGKTLRRGPSTGELSPEEQNIVWYRQQRIREGALDDQIYRELKDKRKLTKGNYDRLKKFRLDTP